MPSKGCFDERVLEVGHMNIAGVSFQMENFGADMNYLVNCIYAPLPEWV